MTLSPVFYCRVALSVHSKPEFHISLSIRMIINNISNRRTMGEGAECTGVACDIITMSLYSGNALSAQLNDNIYLGPLPPLFISGDWCTFPCVHYNDVIMSTVASQITSLMVVYSIVYSGGSKKTSKLRVTGLCAGISLVTGEFPVQRASDAENAFIWWRHHGYVYATHSHDDVVAFKYIPLYF